MSLARQIRKQGWRSQPKSPSSTAQLIRSASGMVYLDPNPTETTIALRPKKQDLFSRCRRFLSHVCCIG